jgi:uncharacterized membrane protein YesL
VERVEGGDGMSTDAQLGLGWTGRVMQLLNAAWTLVLVNLLFLAGVLAGLILFGVMPAGTAAASVLLQGADAIEGHGGVIRVFIRTYRAEFRRANLAGLPFLAAAGLLGADAFVLPQREGPAATALTALTAVIGLVVLLAWVTVITLLARYDDRPIALLRYAVVVPLSFPLTSVGVLVVLGAVGVIAAIFPVVVPLVGASLPLAIAARLIDRRLARLDPQHPLVSPQRQTSAHPLSSPHPAAPAA